MLIFIFRPIFPVVEYMVNYDYIASVLCENTDKPEMQCNGKCYVAKELNKSLEHKGLVQFEKATHLLDCIPAYVYNSDFSNLFQYLKAMRVLGTSINLYNYLYSSVVLQPPI